MNRLAILVGLILFHLGLPSVHSQEIGTNAFVNFETAPVHPVAVSPGFTTVAVCNLPDGRVELYDATQSPPLHIASVPVGIDPVTVRFRTANELWVVNHISDSINIIDVEKRLVVGLIETGDGPADVIFAGTPERAFISCPSLNLVQVFDPASGAFTGSIDIAAERPKAMAVSPDGTKIYVAILESGNSTTILAPRFTGLDHVPPAGPVDLPNGPYGGINPPPNSGTNFFPEISTNLPASNPPPRVSLIVRRNEQGRWLDDNNRDWTEFVSGTNAPFSGRVEGWDLVDRDIAVIDTSDLSVTYVERLMNICLDLAVNSATGQIALIGTEAMNHLRYEPVLQGIFTRAHIALVPPGELDSPSIRDLNSHLTYDRPSIPEPDRKNTLGDPRGVLWDEQGERIFVLGMGSDNLLVLDPEGNRVGPPVVLSGGPSGMALDPSRNRLYVLNRFGANLTLLDTENMQVTATLPFFDPTPAPIRLGRVHFYNTHKSSGLGQASCASCHIDGRMDRLAWDLGTPIGAIKEITPVNRNFGSVIPARTNNFHPMKGPMVTQTLQDIIGHEPFHWRGDRDGLEEFNPTFMELQGAEELTEAEMQEFENFLASLHFPPNRFRNFDNTLSRNVPLKGHVSLGRGQLFKGEPLPNGDAASGFVLFRSIANTCMQCHTVPSGAGADRSFRNSWSPIPTGPNGEHHLALAALERSHELPLKIPHLRNLADKVGLNYLGTSQSGFGFLHDGGVDSLTRFLQDGFNFFNDKETADLIAFLLSFSGSDLVVFSSPQNPAIAPGDFSRDAPAALGQQSLVVSSTAPAFESLLARASTSGSRVELVARGVVDGKVRGWLWNPFVQQFLTDHENEMLSRTELLARATADNPLLFTLVPAGSGRRLGIDRDLDGVLDFDETGPPLVASQTPLDVAAVELEKGILRIQWTAIPSRRYRLWSSDLLDPGDWMPLGEVIEASSEQASIDQSFPSQPQRFFKIELLPEAK